MCHNVWATLLIGRDQKLSIAKHSGIVDREGIIPPHQQWWHCWPGGIIPSPSTMPGRSLEGVWFPRVQNECLTTARQESSPIIPYIYQTRKYSREPGMVVTTTHNPLIWYKRGQLEGIGKSHDNKARWRSKDMAWGILICCNWWSSKRSVDTREGGWREQERVMTNNEVRWRSKGMA